MRPPADLDPDMRTVIEIVEHAAEIVSRLPLSVLKMHLRQYREDDPKAEWYAAALRLIMSAESLELDGGKLSALQARVDVIAPTPLGELPEDWR
jgi:hypothetical protein